MKKLKCIFAVFLMLLAVTPALAADGRNAFVTDTEFVLNEAEVEKLNKQASAVFEKTGVGVYFYNTSVPGTSDAYGYPVGFYDMVSYTPDGIFLLSTDDTQTISYYGSAVDKFTQEDANELLNLYAENNGLGYYERTSEYIAKAGEMLDNYGYKAAPVERKYQRLTDNADLLTPGEETALLAKLNEISERQSFDVVIVTVRSIDGKGSVREYADDFYDYNGFGMGASRDGCLLLISMEERDWYISTRGYGITALTDAGIAYIGEEMISSGLSDGEYDAVFDRFASLCDEFVTKAKTGEPYDYENLPRTYNPFVVVFISFIPGVFISYAIVNRMKRKLTTVSLKNEANDYVIRDAVKIKNSRDVFTHDTVAKTIIVTTSSGGGRSGGGSSTHVSSSGSSHGGGGGKF